MTPAPARLSAPWLTAPATRACLAALDSADPGGQRFVGGCVRNALLGAPATDIDIATRLEPPAVIAAAAKAGIPAIPTGVEHGTVTLVVDHHPFEVTTLRRDVSTDGRRATVAFTTDWAEDAARRDFTMNALYAAPDGTVFDPTGQGLDDLAARRVRFIGDADRRIAEDYLRVLRFYRFSAWYGRGGLDAEGLAACTAALPQLERFAGGALSAERVWAELKKLLAAPTPLGALEAAEPVIAAVIAPAPWTTDLPRFSALLDQEAEHFLPADPLLRLVALALPDLGAARAFGVALKLANAEKERLAAMLRPLAAPAGAVRSFMSVRELRRTLYLIGPEAFADRVRLAWAADPKTRTAPMWRALLAHAAGYQRPQLPIGGAEAMAAGAPPGPVVGEILREVEAWWIDADFPDDPLAVVERLKAVTQALA